MQSTFNNLKAMETKQIQNFLNSYSVKMIVVMGLAIVLLIPSFFHSGFDSRTDCAERTGGNRNFTRNGAESRWFAGPVLNVPFVVQEQNGNGQGMIDRKGIAHFLPETLKTSGELLPEKRKRGIYEVVVYEGKLSLKGAFAQPDGSQLEIQNAQYNWDAAYFTIGISDMRGIKNLPELIVNGQHCAVEPGVADTDLFKSGITVKAGKIDLKQPLNFEMELVLNGSEDLSVEPLGKTSEVTMKSTWSQPSFTGAFLPETRNVTASGFTADWRVTHLNRNFPQQWAGSIIQHPRRHNGASSC